MYYIIHGKAIIFALSTTQIKQNKMKQVIDFKSLWFNTKRALYAIMVMALTLSVPLLSYMELSRKENKEETIKEVKSEVIAKQPTAVYPKQS